jgi:hypothetical protein
MRKKERLFTIKEIAQELEISDKWLHVILKPYKPLFKAPGNMSTATRKTFYTQAERVLVLGIWEKLPYTHRCKLSNL